MANRTIYIPEHLVEIWDNLPDKSATVQKMITAPAAPGVHAHQFSIPVEWEDFYTTAIKPSVIANLKAGVLTPFDGKKVTRLRCACGEEVAR